MANSFVELNDNMRFMSQFPDGFFDLGLLDPEYGRNESGGVNRSRMVKQANGSRSHVKGDGYSWKKWDKNPAGKEYFDEVFRVTKNQIIFGCNYYYANFGPGRIVWDKVNDGSDQSDCEIAYCSMTDKVHIIRYMWRGMMQGKSISEGMVMQGNKKLNEKRIHPTQKHVLLYKKLLKDWANPGWKIADFNMGSGSSRIAAYDLGFDYWGCDNESEYFELQDKRFKKHTSNYTIPYA
jgi:site-specific DNA-methyltransferase (adenine-specific)